MSRHTFPTVLLVLSGVLLATADEPKKVSPKFKIGKDTTFVEGPFNADGYIDYETALNERLRGKITPETNAVAQLLKCFGPKTDGKEQPPEYYRWLGVKAPPETGDYLISINTWFKEELKGEDYSKFMELDYRLRFHPWKREDSPKHAELLKVNEKALALAIEATKCKHFYEPIVVRLPDGKPGMLISNPQFVIQKCREIASLLSVRAMYKLGEGKSEEALDDLLAIHRLARLLGEHGSIIARLAGIAINTIAHHCDLTVFELGKLTAKQSMAYQAELLKLHQRESLTRCIDWTDRFSHLDAFQSSHRDGFKNTIEHIMFLTPTQLEDMKEVVKLAKGDFDFELIFLLCNSWFDRMILALNKPTRAERSQALAELDKESRQFLSDIQPLTPLQKFFLIAEEPDKRKAKISERIWKTSVIHDITAYRSMSNSLDRQEQQSLNGILAAGLAAYFADKKTYPDQLKELVPKYLAQVPGDLFNGKELKYQKTETGYLFYSVGVNEEDDNGQSYGDDPRGDDLGVHMPRRPEPKRE